MTAPSIKPCPAYDHVLSGHVGNGLEACEECPNRAPSAAEAFVAWLEKQAAHPHGAEVLRLSNGTYEVIGINGSRYSGATVAECAAKIAEQKQ